MTATEESPNQVERLTIYSAVAGGYETTVCGEELARFDHAPLERRLLLAYCVPHFVFLVLPKVEGALTRRESAQKLFRQRSIEVLPDHDLPRRASRLALRRPLFH